MTATPRRRAPKGQGDRLRQEILGAAERLLIETGSEEAVSIRAISEAVGVTPPSIYRHFEDKDHLIFEVCARQFEALHAAIAAAARGIDDPIEVLAARGRAYIRFGLDHPEHYRIMFLARTSLSPAQWMGELLDEGSAFAGLVENIQDAIDAGHIEPVGDAFATALHVWASIHGLTSLLALKPDLPWPDRDRLIDDHLDRCLRGLAPVPARERPGRDRATRATAPPVRRSRRP